MLNFADGMDTKTDAKQLPLGQFYQVKNGVYTTPLELRKRNGYKKRSLQQTNSQFISSPVSLSRFDNSLLTLNSTDLYAYSDSTEKWVQKGHVSNLKTTSLPVIKNNYNQTVPHVASNFGTSAYVWKDSVGGCRLSVVDTAANTFFLHNVQLSATAINPKVIVNSNSFYFFFIDGANLKYRKLNSANPTTLEAEVTVKTDVDVAFPVYDLATTNNRIYCAYRSTIAGTELQIFSIDETDTILTTAGVVGAAPTTTISLFTDTASRVCLAYVEGNDVNFLIYNFSLTGFLLPPTLIETITNINNIAIGSKQLNNYYLLYTQTATNTYDYLIKRNTITYSGTVGTPSIFLRSVGQASKIVNVNDQLYSLCVHESALQSTYFLANIDGQIEAKISSTLGGTVLPNNSLSFVPKLSNSQALFVSQIKSELVNENAVTFSTFGVNSSVVEFVPTLNYQDDILGKNLYITGGILRCYDGVSVVEDGFFLFPENLEVGGNLNFGGNLTDGTRSYVAVYAWYDNKGQLHRSTTSLPLLTTQSAGTSTQRQEVIIPTLRLSYKTDIIIEVYRTENNGTVFYKVSSTVAPTFNDPSVNSIIYSDGTSDANLLGREILYTSGGILDNDQAPNASIIVNWKNRIWLAGLENPQQLAYSKELTEGYPAQFSDFLRLQIDDAVGPITALAVLDDKLIIFKETSMFALAGNGPNNAGQQNDYATPDRIASDVGCIDSNSVVLTPMGLMFKSTKGIYLLDRGLSTTYIGAAVEIYNDLSINSSVLVPNSNQIRFLTSGDVALVYDYFMQRWSVFDNHGGKDAEIVNNVYIYLRNDDTIFVETPNQFLDNGQPISLEVDTGWLSFAGVQGFQRVYKMLALGEYKSPHKLRIQCAYNFVEAYLHEKTIDSSEVINQSTYGQVSPYGGDAKYGGPSKLNGYQMRLDFKIQKTQSIRVLITELQNDSYGEGLSLSNLSFEVGAKRGQFQVNQSQTFGTK